MPTSTKMKSVPKLVHKIAKNNKMLTMECVNSVILSVCDLSISNPETIATILLHGQYREGLRKQGNLQEKKIEPIPETNGCGSC